MGNVTAMRVFAVSGAALLGALATPALAQQQVLTFDDLPGQNYFTANYNGFKFGNNDPATNPWFWSNQTSAYYSPKSGATYIATDSSLYDPSNTYQATLPISRSTAFIFNGAYFSGIDKVGYQLYLNNALVYTSGQSATLTSTPIFVGSGYGGAVDQVVVFGPQGFYALDNFTYQNILPAPEPASWALLLLGFGGVGVTVRYRRTAKAVSA